MKTLEIKLLTVIIATILLIIVPFIPGAIFGYSVGFDSGWNNCLKQVMQTKNNDQYEKLSPDVKAALSQMERAKAVTIAGAGADTAQAAGE